MSAILSACVSIADKICGNRGPGFPHSQWLWGREIFVSDAHLPTD